MAGALTSLVIKLALDASGVKQGVADAEKSIGGLSDRVGASLKKNATKISLGIGGALGAGLADATAGAAKFEDQLRTINTVAKLPEASLKALGDQIQSLSRETGKTTEDLTAGFYDLVSAGVPADQAIGVLKDSAILATGALGTTGEAVDLVTSAMNAYGLKAKDSTRITDIFATAVQDGKVTAAELGTSLANIAPIAAAAGVSMEEVSAGYALMTAKGTPAAQAATQMRAAISALLTPNLELAKLSKKVGVNFAEMAKEKGLAVTLEEIRKATGGNNEMFAKSLGSVEAYQYALATTGDNAGAAATELGKIKAGADKGGVALAQYTEKMKSPIEQGKKLAASVATFAQDIGKWFEPVAPLLTAFGPVWGKALGAAFGVVGPLAMALLKGPKVLAAAEEAGAAQAAAMAGSEAGGGLLGKFKGALGGRLGTIIKGAGLLALAAAAPEIEKAAGELGGSINESIFHTSQANAQGGALAGTAFDSLGDAIHGAADQLSNFGVSWKDGKIVLGDLSATADNTTVALDATAGAVLGAATAAGAATPAVAKVADAFSGAATSVVSAGTSMGAAIAAFGATSGLDGSRATWYERGKNLTGAIGKGMQDGATLVLGAFDTLRTLLKDGFSPATLAKELREHGKKYMDVFVEGMHSKIIGAQQAAEDAGLAAIAALSSAGFKGVNGSKSLRQIGQYYDELLAGGMLASQIDVALKAAGVSDAAIAAIHAKYPRFGEAGLASGSKLGAGLTSSVPAVRGASGDLANAAMGPLGVVWQRQFTGFGNHAANNLIGAFGGHVVQAEAVSLNIAKGLARHLANSEPPPGPLHSIREWVPHMIDHLVKSGQAHVGKLAALGNDMAGALAPALAPMGGSMGLSLDRTFRIEVSLRDVQPGVDERALGQGIGDVIGTLTGALRREFRT